MVLAMVACDSSARVGEVRPEEPAPPGPTFVPLETEDAGAPQPEWRLHSPSIPCTIYALEARQADKLYVGCAGGRIYRYDGVKASVEYTAEDEKVIFSLLWDAQNGEVWAGAQQSYKGDAKTQLYHFDGKQWSKVGSASERITSLTGFGKDVWITTESQIRHYDGKKFVTSFTTPKGSFRACTFANANEGYCVGSEGLAVVWNGETWSSSLTNVPWSTNAEIFGVELDTYPKKRAVFLYGEPFKDPHGDHLCRATSYADGAFTTGSAKQNCFTDFDVARRRTGQVNVEFSTKFLLSPDDSSVGALAFNLEDDQITPVCGPALAFSSGQANTHVGGKYGFFGTLLASGGKQLSTDVLFGSDIEFRNLSVAPNGTAWARTESATACGSVSDRLVRFEDGVWSPVAAPQGALSGIGLTAVSRDQALTADPFTDALLVREGETWNPGPAVKNAWSLFASKADDVWIGTSDGGFGHVDGKTFTLTGQPTGSRQVNQILAVDDEVWMLELGYTQQDTDEHIVRWADGKRTEWNPGSLRADSAIQLAAIDKTHVYRSGHPAQMWNGKAWVKYSFDAYGVWARSLDEVYFTSGNDICRLKGKECELAYHGVSSIIAIAGSKDHAIAVGYGGLTIEFAEWPDSKH